MRGQLIRVIRYIIQELKRKIQHQTETEKRRLALRSRFSTFPDYANRRRRRGRNVKICRVKQLLEHHKAPLVKLDLFGQRLFFKNEDNTDDALDCNLGKLEKALRHTKVERRCGRSLGEWLPGDNLTKVTRPVKGLLYHSGYQDKNGMFLYPEETLFLLETNKLEVTLNGIPLSIQDGYDSFLRVPGMSLGRYIVYKKLRLHGFRLSRYAVLTSRKMKHKMRCDDESKDDGVKKRLIVEDGDSSYEADLMRRLQSKGPKKWSEGGACDSQVEEDYCVFLSNNKSRVEHDFNLKICEGDILGDFRESNEKPTIYGVCCGDNISFYKLAGIGTN